MPSNRLAEGSIWHAFLHLKQIQNRPKKKKKRKPRHPTMQHVPSADGLFTAEKIDISLLKYPVSRDECTPVCILIVTGAAKANTQIQLGKKKRAAGLKSLTCCSLKYSEGRVGESEKQTLRQETKPKYHERGWSAEGKNTQNVNALPIHLLPQRPRVSTPLSPPPPPTLQSHSLPSPPLLFPPLPLEVLE